MRTQTKIGTWVRGVGRTAAGSLRDAWERETERLTFSDLGREETERLFRDIGLPPNQGVSCLDQPFANEDLAGSLMEVVGLDRCELTAAQPAVMRDIERVCMACTARRLCRRNLSRGEAARAYRAYCPNAGTFEDLEAIHA
ncbi:hypothetical protein [Lutibaculum baratangense]|uniref:Uncharacterized protein n=1 Tax=Lutibaculum baratangense AMV1 TaxID=631454 RepID=V4RF88_9HYPH|nr:hypothetical protein [Lutibaculum baratangense]ESR24806.1 hypothetical protein N177_2129 [Lutibaculum baratangense AMV1]